MKTLLLSLITASAMLANGIWNYTGGDFMYCAAGDCPAYTQNDSLDATFVFNEEIPMDGVGTTQTANVTSWSMSDTLDHFSFSSTDQNAIGELEYAKLAQLQNGDIHHYTVVSTTAPCAIQECQKGESALGILTGMDEVVFDFGNQDSWTAVFNAGSWVDPPFAAVASAPEPGTAWLLLLTVVVVAGFVVLYRSEPKR